MNDSSHIDELRRRVQQDPASIAFAQLAEELRRAGELQESLDVCRRGLSRHPSYLSAHVTLGRTLAQLGRHDQAFESFDLVRRASPQNLAALRGLADIQRQRGQYREALSLFQTAYLLAPNDPDIERSIEALLPLIAPESELQRPAALLREVVTVAADDEPDVTAAYSLVDAQIEGGYPSSADHADGTGPRADVIDAAVSSDVALAPDVIAAAIGSTAAAQDDAASTTPDQDAQHLRVDDAAGWAVDETVGATAPVAAVEADAGLSVGDLSATATESPRAQAIAALEQWLAAIHVTRTQRIS